MKSSINCVRTVIAFVMASVAAQNTSPASIQHLLTPDAKIIETAALHTTSGKPRTLVLWMEHPNRVMRRREWSCSDLVYGEHWYGPTRLSLFDPANEKIINTVEIRGLYEGSNHPEHEFPVPFFVDNTFYYVPHTNAKKEGRPKILNLRDLTGEGIAGQFVLYEYEVCGTALTAVLGYSRTTDTVVQYRLEILELGEKTETVSWVPHIFGVNAVRPGFWKFTWEPGHGADCWIDEQVSFDRERRMFVDHRRVRPYPDIPVRQK